MCNLGFPFFLELQVCVVVSSLLYFHFSLAHRLYEYVLRWVGSGWAFSEHVYEREREEREKRREKKKKREGRILLQQ